MSSPVASPIASSHTARKPVPGAGSRQISVPNVSLPSRSSSRVSARQLDHISRHLTQLDQDVLDLLADVRIASGDHLRRRFWAEGEATPESRARMGRRALRRLVDWRVLDVLPRRVGGIRAGSDGLIYHLGPAGLRLRAQRGFEAKRLSAPGDRYINHTLTVAETVVRLHEADRAGELDVIEVQTEPRCWRGFLGPFGSRLIVKPDLFVRLGAGAFEWRAFVEIDRSTESRGTLIRKGRVYLDHYRSGSEQRESGVYPQVVWSVPDDRRAEQLTAALSALPIEASKLFVVTRFEELIDRLAEGARA